MLCSSVASPARADESPAAIAELEAARPAARIEVPPGVVLTKDGGQLEVTIRAMRTAVKGGEEYKCFSRDEWATLGHLVIDYRWFWNHTLRLEAELKIRLAELGHARELAEVWKANTATAERGLGTLDKLFDEEHAARLQGERRGAVVQWLMLGGMVLEALVISGLATAYAIK